MALLVLLALLAQAPLVLGWVAPVRMPGEASVNSDVVLPALADAAAVFAQGEWPWWNPYARLGEPFAVSGAQPLYPGFWPLLFFGASALPWVLALHSALACLFMFRWLRALPSTRFTAFLGAGLWGIGVFFQLQLQRLPEAAACAWLPLALEGTWRLTRPGRERKHVAVAALGLAGMFATGARVTPLVGAAVCLGLGVLHLVRVPRADRLRALTSLGLVTLGAALLAAPFWLDAWQHADALERVRVARAGGVSALAAVAPLHAQPALLQAQPLDILQLALFPGTIVLLLVVLAFLRPSPARPRWPWLTIAVLGVASWAQAQGAAPWLPALGLDGALPGCSLVLLQLAVLVLACQGLDGFLESPFRRPAAVVSLGATALGLGLLGSTLAILRPRLLTQWIAHDLAPNDHTGLAALAENVALAIAPTAAGLVLLGITFLAWRFLGVLRLKVALSTLAFAEVLYLAWATAPYRAAPTEIEIVGAAGARVLATDPASVLHLTCSRPPVHRVNTAGDGVLTRTRAFLDLAAPGSLTPGARVRGGDLEPGRFAPQLASLAQIDVLIGDAAPMAHAFASPAGPEARVPAEVPFARLVFDGRHAADISAAGEDLRRRADPGASVVLEGAPGSFTPRASARPPTIEVTRRAANELHLRVDAGQGRGYLVLADAFAPGWHATVDGESTALLPADVAFRAVAIPEGAHEVTLRYAPWAMSAGLPLAALGALFVVACCVRRRRRRSV